jgi:hypothetical protein
MRLSSAGQCPDPGRAKEENMQSQASWGSLRRVSGPYFRLGVLPLPPPDGLPVVLG